MLPATSVAPFWFIMVGKIRVVLDTSARILIHPIRMNYWNLVGVVVVGVIAVVNVPVPESDT